MCRFCENYRPLREDTMTNTEADAGRWERRRAEPDYDTPTRSEAEADERYMERYRHDA